MSLHPGDSHTLGFGGSMHVWSIFVPEEGHCLLTFAPFFVQISWNLNRLGTPLDEVSLSLKRVTKHREIWRIATAGVSHLEVGHQS
jgi:hypothetical protein